MSSCSTDQASPPTTTPTFFATSSRDSTPSPTAGTWSCSALSGTGSRPISRNRREGTVRSAASSCIPSCSRRRSGGSIRRASPARTSCTRFFATCATPWLLERDGPPEVGRLDDDYGAQHQHATERLEEREPVTQEQDRQRYGHHQLERADQRCARRAHARKTRQEERDGDHRRHHRDSHADRPGLWRDRQDQLALKQRDEAEHDRRP